MVGALVEAIASVAPLVAAEALEHETPRWHLTRAHVDALRLSGHTRRQVVELVEGIGGPDLAEVIADDLDSYGEWTDG